MSLQGGVTITHIDSDSDIYGILSTQGLGHGLHILILPQCIMGPPPLSPFTFSLVSQTHLSLNCIETVLE